MWEGFQLEQGGPKTGEWTVQRGEAESCLILAGSAGARRGVAGRWGRGVSSCAPWVQQTDQRSGLSDWRAELRGRMWTRQRARAVDTVSSGRPRGIHLFAHLALLMWPAVCSLPAYKGQLKAEGRVLHATRMMYRGPFRRKK